MIRYFCISLLGLALLALARADEDKKPPRPRCPVTGKAAQQKHSLPYRGGKIYFCCADCPKTFQTQADKFTTKANAQLVVTGQAHQVACPVTGEDVRPQRALNVAGVKVLFCCIGCQGKVAAADEEIRLYLVFGNNAFDKGFKVGKKTRESSGEH